jgi:hypothetical protein
MGDPATPCPGPQNFAAIQPLTQQPYPGGRPERNGLLNRNCLVKHRAEAGYGGFGAAAVRLNQQSAK